MEQDVRWKQRFQNYEKAVEQLADGLDYYRNNPVDVVLDGVIHRFECAFDLAWNVMKDYLLYQGVTGVTGSRDAIRQAFHKELISDGQVWMNMVDDRIKTVHSYDEKIIEKMEAKIYDEYYAQFQQFYNKMKSLL